MTEFFMDEDGNIPREAATTNDLVAWANDYDQKYFSGSSPDITIAIDCRLGSAGCFMPDERKIYIPKGLTAFEKPCRIVLLHEMVHIKLGGENGDFDELHGQRFKSEIARLIQCGAYDNLL